jgi:hypothetical protein
MISVSLQTMKEIYSPELLLFPQKPQFINYIRARQLISGAQRLTECNSHKEVTVAINEVNENKVTYVRAK